MINVSLLWFNIFFLIFIDSVKILCIILLVIHLHGETLMFANIKSFVADESGATAIEYGLIAALVSVAAIAALRGMGNSLQNLFTLVSGELQSAVTSAGG